jgi:hypothetical protein
MAATLPALPSTIRKSREQLAARVRPVSSCGSAIGEFGPHPQLLDLDECCSASAALSGHAVVRGGLELLREQVTRGWRDRTIVEIFTGIVDDPTLREKGRSVMRGTTGFTGSATTAPARRQRPQPSVYIEGLRDLRGLVARIRRWLSSGRRGVDLPFRIEVSSTDVQPRTDEHGSAERAAASFHVGRRRRRSCRSRRRDEH